MKNFLRKIASLINIKTITGFSFREKGAALSALMRRMPDFHVMRKILETRRFQRPTSPSPVYAPSGNRLMIIAPHHDDDIIGCGGIILHSIRSGKNVMPVYVTDGMNASPQYSMDQMVAIRKKEAREVWEKIGGTPPVFLDIPNKNFCLGTDNVLKFYNAIINFNPDCIFIPFFLEDPDAHRKTVHLFYLASKVGSFPCSEVWSYQVSSMICPNIYADISDVIEEKCELMRIWESQNSVFNYEHYCRGLNAYNSLFCRQKGGQATYLELFFVVDTGEYIQMIERYYSQPMEMIYGDKTRY